MEGRPGRLVTCDECGHVAPISSTRRVSSRERTDAESGVPWRALVAPVAFLAGVASLGTFYLAPMGIPFILAALALGAGAVAHLRLGRGSQSVAAMLLGGAGLVVAMVSVAAS